MSTQPRNKGDVEAIIRNTDHALTEIAQHAVWLWTKSKTWQSPLRAGGGGRSGKGSHSDPTALATINPDGLAQVHRECVAALQAVEKSTNELLAMVRQYKPLREDEVDRTRQNTVAICVVCDGPAFPVRAGKCNACRMAWERADRPSLITFRRERAKLAEEKARRLHEHEQAS